MRVLHELIFMFVVEIQLLEECIHALGDELISHRQDSNYGASHGRQLTFGAKLHCEEDWQNVD